MTYHQLYYQAHRKRIRKQQEKYYYVNRAIILKKSQDKRNAEKDGIGPALFETEGL